MTFDICRLNVNMTIIALLIYVTYNDKQRKIVKLNISHSLTAHRTSLVYC